MPSVLFRLRRILTDTNTEWNIAYDQLGFERNTASPLQSIDRDMGLGLASSRRHAACLPELSAQERDSLADILRRLTARYDAVFETPFPYSMGLPSTAHRW